MSVMRALRSGIADEPVKLLRDVRGDQYLLVQRLHEGRETCVYLATPAKETRPLALKRVRPSRCGDQNAHDRIVFEDGVLDRLDHPYIVKNFGHSQCDDGTAFFTMEYVDGRDLAEIMESSGSGFVTPTQVLAVATACAAALVACHEGGDDDRELCITHGNLVASNVMITRTGELKVIDFGAATWVPRGSELGQIDPAEASEARKDVIALGLLLYQLTTGKTHLSAIERASVSPSSIPRALPHKLRRIMARILDRGSEPWYRSMRHVYEDLRELTSLDLDRNSLRALAEAIPSPAPVATWLSESALEIEDADEDPSLAFLSTTEIRRALRRTDEAALLSWIEDIESSDEAG